MEDAVSFSGREEREGELSEWKTREEDSRAEIVEKDEASGWEESFLSTLLQAARDRHRHKEIRIVESFLCMACHS